MTNPDPTKFLESLNSELESQACRVRNLIGSAHWVSDGRHKESLVSNVVARYLPDGYRISSGFGINVGTVGEVSRELDVTILDCQGDSPILDQFGSSIGAFENLAGVVSVKSKLTKKSFLQTIENLASVAIPTKDYKSPMKCCLTTFFFDDEIANCLSTANEIKRWFDKDSDFASHLKAVSDFPFVVGTTSNLFIRCRRVEKVDDTSVNQLCFYESPKLSFALLVSFIQSSLSLRTGKGTTTLQTLVDNYEQSNLIASWDLSDNTLDVPA